MAALAELQHAHGAEHRVLANVPSAARRQLVAPSEKVTHVVIQVSLDRPVRGVV